MTINKKTGIINQLLIFATILFISDLIANLLPDGFPLSGPVIGIIILYLLLTMKIIKLHQVETLASFFIKILPFLIIPSGIELITSIDVLHKYGFKLIIMIFLSTILMVLSVSVTTALLIFIQKKIKKIFKKGDNL
ncbi:CidA/LrgA family protein [Lactobacillus sp. S2-2]|uniref:CidA/LrgA family protein n=1 Tax=Lactobacillus sp. S2-2 TaxID=2692917 RepID=UPI001F8BE845|nr:CidA/LrgA family protein [Lactobacillus sp. S2-2]